MAVQSTTVNGAKYELAPAEPELHDHPSPSYPVVITPAIARNYLRFNYRNRNQRDQGKRNYGTDMSEGNFDINGDAIRFSRPLTKGEDERVPEGSVVLLDGQHRLQACIDSGAPFVAYVTYGLDPRVRRTIDKGIKRSFADDLKMDGETQSVVLASVIARAYAYSKGDRRLTLKKVTMTNTQGMDFFDEHPELRRSTSEAARVHDEFLESNIRQSVVGVAHWLFTQADPATAPEFFARLGDGALPSKDVPMYRLRRRILQDKRRRDSSVRKDKFYVPDWQLFCYMIRTWNVQLKNELTTDEQAKAEFALVGSSDHRQMPDILAPHREDNGVITSFSPLSVGVFDLEELLGDVPGQRTSNDDNE